MHFRSTLKRVLSSFLCGIVVLGSLKFSPEAEAAGPTSNTRVFVLTATYGVMAGTLTGLASLAFYRNPGSHLRNVAMGASIGLYLGIFLGAYILQFPPGAPTKAELDLSQSSWQPIIAMTETGDPLLGVHLSF